MLFRPAKVAELWDSWLYRHEDAHWMFFLHKSDGSRWDGISLARSADGVHYEELGTVVEVAPDADSLGSGTVHRLPDGRFIMNLSETRRGIQRIFFLASRDLRSWHRLSDPGPLVPDSRFYDDGPTGRWDGIDVLARPGGGCVGYLTARPWNRPDDPEYVSVGKLESDDGLHWRATTPPRIAWGSFPESSMYEVGGIELVDGRYRMMICQVAAERRLGRRTAWRPGIGDAGMYGFSSASIDGPFEPDGRSYRLLTSPSWIPGGLPFSGMSHFTRFYRCGTDVLVNHHVVEFCGEGSHVWFAPLKQAQAGPAGELRLAWWKGNAALKGRPLGIVPGGGETILQAPGLPWTIHDGALAATANSSGGIYLLAGRFDPAVGAVVEMRVTVRAAPRALGSIGIVVGHGVGGLIGYPTPVGIGTAFLLGTRGQTTIGLMDRSGTIFPQNIVEKGITDGSAAFLRLLVRRGMCELYRDDELVQCWSLPTMPTGDLLVAFEGGSAVFERIEAWRMA